ncbi:hypothetical protein, partial [Bacillus cereus]|uniref:hypothetical protein n=1 Tax=Bacillus cereus TaxID=1396 RepID=UPI0020D1FF0A
YGQLIYTILVIGSEEKDESLISQGNRLFLFYGSMHFLIHFYPAAVLGFLSVIELTKKLYKILYTLSVVFSEILAVPHHHQANIFISP